MRSIASLSLFSPLCVVVHPIRDPRRLSKFSHSREALARASGAKNRAIVDEKRTGEREREGTGRIVNPLSRTIMEFDVNRKQTR